MCKELYGLSLQIHCDLVQVATRGAMLVVDGFIPALNPADEEKSATNHHHVTMSLD